LFLHVHSFIQQGRARNTGPGVARRGLTLSQPRLCVKREFVTFVNLSLARGKRRIMSLIPDDKKTEAQKALAYHPKVAKPAKHEKEEHTPGKKDASAKQPEAK
jgi:hypothetical protein